MFKRHLHPTPNLPTNPNENEVSSSKSDSLDEEVPTAPKKRGRKPGSVSLNSQTETLKKIRTTLEMVFSSAAGMAIMAGTASNNDALKNDAVILSPVTIDVQNATSVPNKPIQNLIEAILVLCQQDKNVRDMLLSLSSSSAYANVLFATLPIVIMILVNHNLIPPLFQFANVPNVGG